MKKTIILTIQVFVAMVLEDMIKIVKEKINDYPIGFDKNGLKKGTLNVPTKNRYLTLKA